MTSFRDRVNAHLPIVLQFISTASLVVLALSAICGSKSLKQIVESHEAQSSVNLHQGHSHQQNHKMKR